MTDSAPGKLRMKGPGHEQGLLRCSAWATAVPGAAQGVVRMMQAAQPQKCTIGVCLAGSPLKNVGNDA